MSSLDESIVVVISLVLTLKTKKFSTISLKLSFAKKNLITKSRQSCQSHQMTLTTLNTLTILTTWTSTKKKLGQNREKNLLEANHS